jgi:hypothetical protein
MLTMPIVGNGGIPIASCVGARYISFGSVPQLIIITIFLPWKNQCYYVFPNVKIRSTKFENVWLVSILINISNSCQNLILNT